MTVEEPPRPARAPARAVLTALLAAMVTLLAGVLSSAGASAAEPCPNEAVRNEQHSTYLPACRGFELVSPALKNEQEVEVPGQYAFEVPFQAAAEGAGVTYTLTGAIPGSASGGLYTTALGRSAAAASPWQTTPLNPENQFGVLPGPGPRLSGAFGYYSPNLTCGVEQTRLPQPAHNGESTYQLPPGEEAAEGIENLYEWDAATGTYTLMTSVRPEAPQEVPFTAHSYTVDGASTGCGHVIFQTEKGYQQPGQPGIALYEWSAGGAPVVASVLPDGKAVELSGVFESRFNSTKLNEISSDGSRVFFAAVSDGANGEAIDSGAQEVYMRVGGTSTVEISASQTAAPVRDSGAKFQAATRDGKQVFFTANYGLTERTSSDVEHTACVAVPGAMTAGTGCDLYVYDTETGALKDLSADLEAETGDKKGATVRGVLGISEDGSYVYFSAAGQLKPGEGNSEGTNEAQHEANVYAYHEGTLSYVTTIKENEAGGGGEGSAKVQPEEEIDAIASSLGHGMQYMVSRVSPDGQRLLLATSRKLTAYNNEDAITKKPDPELYEYRYTTGPGSVTCVSCDPTGAQPLVKPGSLFGPLSPYVEIHLGVIPRNLANDGRVYFDSYDPLAPRAVKAFEGGIKTVNVYEWQPEGVGGCEQASGCANLLDSGEDTFPSYFVGASADSQTENVYITTHAQLAPQDQDGLRDLYDLRVGGGSQMGSVSRCEEDCHGPLPEPIGSSTHASEANIGNGNLSSSPPPAGNGVQGFTAHSIKITKHATKRATLTLVVATSVGGRLTVSGAGVGTVGKTVAGPGSYTLKVSLSAKGKAAVKRKKRLKVAVRVTFVPSSGAPSSSTVTVTFA